MEIQPVNSLAGQAFNQTYPIFKYIVEELEDKSFKLTIYVKMQKNVNFRKELQVIIDDISLINEYINTLKNNSNLLKKRIIESYAMFSVSGIVFSNIKFNKTNKIISGKLVNTEIKDFFDFPEKNRKNDRYSFNLIEKLISKNIKFYKKDESIQIGVYIYKNGECMII